jgi:hypothetical protein
MDIDLQSVQNFFTWAEIEKDGFIELNCIGKKVGSHTNTTIFPEQVIEHISAYEPGDALWCVGVNPRATAGGSGTGGAARDSDMRIFKNLYLDIETIHAPHTNVSLIERDNVFVFADKILSGGTTLQDVVLADSGNGVHICIAIPPYDNPQEFGAKLQTWYKTRLLPKTKSLRDKYNVRIDSTFSPSRQVKLYGTKKPIEGARLSRFPAVERHESAGFRDYILSFPEKPKTMVAVEFGSQKSVGTLQEIEERYGLER